jgi:hypothetical protein
MPEYIGMKLSYPCDLELAGKLQFFKKTEKPLAVKRTLM